MSFSNIGSIVSIDVTLSKNIDSLSGESTGTAFLWEPLAFTPLSASFQQSVKDTKNGLVYTQTLTFKLPKVQKSVESFFSTYQGQPVAFRFKDANGNVYILGEMAYPAYFTAHTVVPDKPESYNGYSVRAICITHSSLFISG